MTDFSFSRLPSAAVALLLVLSLGLSGCADETLTSPNTQNDLFQSYVALGNSLTAGLQSGGINQETQADAFPVLLAEQMNTPFTIPALSNPGCPPPLAQVLPPETIAPGTDCALRTGSTKSGINNVAVPNAAVIDILSNRPSLANPNALTQFILGGRTQIEAAEEMNPTFATVWIGNNDVLDGAILGDTTVVTPIDSFKTRYSRMLSRLESIESLEGAVFLGVANVILIPHFSPGKAYQQAQNQGAGVLPRNFELSSCGPGPSDSGNTLIPFRHGAALIQVADAIQPITPTPTITLDCTKDRTVEKTVRENLDDQVSDSRVEQVVDAIGEDIRPISLLMPDEISFFQDRVSDFNQHIRSEVGENYGYVNPNDLFRMNSEQIPDFPELSDNPDTPWGPDQPFGPLFSLDGIHPSSAAHQLVANDIIDEINTTYDVQLSPVSE